MRLDFEAAEKSYRAFFKEYRRVFRKGGAKKATPVMKATAGGSYLTDLEELVQAFRTLNSRSVGPARIAYMKPVSYKVDS